jgi:hypothetical protein
MYLPSLFCYHVAVSRGQGRTSQVMFQAHACTHVPEITCDARVPDHTCDHICAQVVGCNKSHGKRSLRLSCGSQRPPVWVEARDLATTAQAIIIHPVPPRVLLLRPFCFPSTPIVYLPSVVGSVHVHIYERGLTGCRCSTESKDDVSGRVHSLHVILEL